MTLTEFAAAASEIVGPKFGHVMGCISFSEDVIKKPWFQIYVIGGSEIKASSPEACLVILRERVKPVPGDIELSEAK